MVKSKIPPALHAVVVRLYSEGRTGEEIAQILLREHGTETSERSVNRLLEKHTAEREAISAAVAAEEFRKLVIPSARRLERMTVSLVNIGVHALKRAADLRATMPHHAGAVQYELEAVKAYVAAAKLSNICLHYAGLNKTDKITAAAGAGKDVRAALLKRLQDLVDKAGAVGAVEVGADEPPVH